MNAGLIYSIFLHSFIILLLWLDVPSFFQKAPIIKEAPIIVDLSQVKIAEITNLPEFIEDNDDDFVKKEKKQNTKKQTSKASKPTKKIKNKKKIEEKPSGFELEDAKIKIEKKKKKKKKKIAKQKIKQKKKIIKSKKKQKMLSRANTSDKRKSKKGSKNTSTNALSSLLASVGDLKKSLPKNNIENLQSYNDEGKSNNKGIKGGIAGNYNKELTISEKDAISARLRNCWNLDAGARGVKDMIIELRAHLNNDGTVRKVDIINKKRYNNDGFYKSVTESAIRAVHICSPYSSLAEKYKSKYELWNTMLLKFNPFNGGVY